MSSTKIINVLKDDSFSEILDLFKATPAEEVIFVLPKSARAFKKEEHFASLRSEAKELDKSVSFLCSNSELNNLAKKYKFDVLLARSPSPKKPTRLANLEPEKSNSINVVNEIEDFYAEPALSEDSISTAQPEEELEESGDGRRLDDIFVPEVENYHNVKVLGGREKIIPIEVNQINQKETKNIWGFLPKLISNRDNFHPRRLSHRTALISLACVAVVILGVVIFITTGKAQVVISPVSQALDLNLTIFTSDNTSAVNLVNMAIPGQLFNVQKTVSQDFTATGHVDVAQKARGTITVYNELTTDQPLIATTRFESTDHHVFHTLTSVTVSASKTVNGKLVPGSKDVQVIADKAGAEYNVPVGLFTIPAFKEQGSTEKYQKVYGQSTAPILNGTSGQSTVVTEADLNTAKQTLTTLLTANIKDELKAQINGLKIVNDGQVIVDNPVSTSPADAKTTIFKVSLSGSLKTVGFKESDLNTLIAQYIDTQKNMITLPEKLVLTYDKARWDDVKNGLSFTVHITGPGYTKVDQQKIVSDLLGKNTMEMKAYLGAITGISSAHVNLSPFWVRSIPNNKDKVQVELSY